jgi:hypothetical protein
MENVKDQLWSGLGVFEEQIPKRGGCVLFWQDVAGPTGTHFCGDRLGFLRLGWVMVRFALTAQRSPTRPNDAAIDTREFFEFPSDIRRLKLRLEQRPAELATPRRKVPPRSTFTLWQFLGFGRKRWAEANQRHEGEDGEPLK